MTTPTTAWAGCASADRCGDVGPAEIRTDIQRWAAVFLGDIVGEVISEDQTGRMQALAPAPIACRDASGRGCGDRHNLDGEPVDQAAHLVADVPALRHDQRFGDR